MVERPAENPIDNNGEATRPTDSIELVRVGWVAELGPDARTVIRTRYEPVLVVNIAGEILAVSDICPHSGGYLHDGPLNGCVLECPLHFWPFDLHSGQLVDMPDSYDERLTTYKVRQIGDELFLEVPRLL